MCLKVVSLLSFCALSVITGGLGVRPKQHHHRHEVELPSEFDQSDLESELPLNREDFEGDDNTLESRGIPNPFTRDRERFDTSLFKKSNEGKGVNIWPKRIPFIVNKDDFTGVHNLTIMEAFHDFRVNTCLNFQFRGKGDPNYISFRKGNGCYSSSIGMKGGAQQIFLDVRKCMNEHDIQHVLMHALGFSHEYLGDRNQLRWFRQKNGEPRKECDISKYQDTTKIVPSTNSIDDDRDSNDSAWYGDNIPEPSIVEDQFSIPELSELDFMKVSKEYKCNCNCRE